MNILFYIVVLGFLLIFLIYSFKEIIWTHFSKKHSAPFVRCPEKAIENLKLNFFPKIKDSDIVYDLGAGDGRLTRVMYSFNPKAKYVGVEYQWWPWILGKIKNKLSRSSQIVWRRTDIFKIDFSNVDILICYLTPELLHLVYEKAKQEISRPLKFVTIGFEIPTQLWEKKFELEKKFFFELKSDVFVYEIKP